VRQNPSSISAGKSWQVQPGTVSEAPQHGSSSSEAALGTPAQTLSELLECELEEAEVLVDLDCEVRYNSEQSGKPLDTIPSR